MIKFLIQRPIAVLMAFTACFIIGLVTYSTLPISLLPNIAIPEITVQVASANTSARELENTIFQAHFSSRSDCITLQDIEDALIPIPLPTDAPACSRITPGGHFDLEAALAEVEKGYIIEALKVAGGNKTRAAHLLGWKTHHNLTQRMEKYGLTPNSSKP